MSEDKSSELPEEVVQKIKDIVREFYDELAKSSKQDQGDVVRPTLAATSTSYALIGFSLVRAANSGELTVQINPSEIAKWDLRNILKDLTILITLLNKIHDLINTFPHEKTLISFLLIVS